MRPETLEGDWNRLYSEFPDVYDAWADCPHRPEPLEVIARQVPLAGGVVVDVGAGTGRSTFELAATAAGVIGVEPNDAMRAVAEERARTSSSRNVSFVAGSASALPVADASVDVVAAVTAVFWPAEDVVPAFVAEALRVLRPGGTVFALNTPPGWYGGDLCDVAAGGAPEYEHTLDRLLAAAGFAYDDFETTQDFGTTENAVATYGFIFGSGAIERLTDRGQTTIRWRWRLRHRRRDGGSPSRRPQRAQVHGGIARLPALEKPLDRRVQDDAVELGRRE